MSRDLLAQLEAYFADVDEQQGPVTEAEIADAAVKVRELPPSAPTPVRQRPRLWVTAAAAAAVTVAIGVVPLIVGSRDTDTPPATEPSAPITTATTTTIAELPATTVADMSDETTPTTSAWDALPAYVRAADWHVGTYESIGYSCESGQPDYVCDAPHRVQYTHMWVGSDYPNIAVDFIDFFGRYEPEAKPFPPDSPYSDGMLLGGVDDNTMPGLGHGIRVTQLDRAPPGLDIGGEAWIRLTISSLSAMDRAQATGKLVPTEVGYRIEAGSEGDPLALHPRGELSLIESVVLVATNGTMSQWIISFNQPGTYAHNAGYWSTGSAYVLGIRFVRL